MIDKNNIPNDGRGAEVHLTACKLQLMDLAAQIANGSITTVEEISAVIWADIEEAELMLEG